MRSRLKCVAGTLLVLLGTVASVGWAAGKPQKKPVPLLNVQLKEMPKLFKSGKAGFYKGQADEEGIKFFIPGTNIMTPVMIGLESSDPAAKLTLQVKNDYSTDWDRTVVTDSTGAVTTRFRTEGPAVAWVRSDGGRKPYRLVVWVGPEVKVHRLMPPPFVSNEEYERLQGASSAWKYVVPALGLLAFAVMAVVLRRRRGA